MTNLRKILALFITLLAMCPRPLGAQSIAATALQVSPNGSLTAVGHLDGHLHIYDSATRTLVRTLQQSGEDVYGLAWSPSGEKLAAVSFNGAVAVWNVQTGVRLVSLNTRQAADISPLITELVAVSWSPDGHQIAVSGQNGGTVVLDAATGAAVYRLEKGETYSNTWAPSQNLVTSTFIGLYVWSNGVELQVIPGLPVTQYPGFIPYRVAYAPDGTLLAAIAGDHSIVDSDVNSIPMLRLYDPVTRNPINSVGIFENAASPRIEWSGDANYIAISGTDGLVRIWEAQSLELVDEIAVGNSYMAFDWHGVDQIAYVQDDGSLDVASVEGISSDLTGTITLPNRTPAAAYSYVFSFDVGIPGTIPSTQIGSITPPLSQFTELTQRDFARYDPTWSPDGSRIAYVASMPDVTRQIFIANADGTGEMRVTFSGMWEGWPQWSPDGQKLVFERTIVENGERNREIILKDLISGSEINLTLHPGADSYPDFSRDGSQIVFSSTRNGSPQLFIMNADSNGLNPVPLPANMWANQARWSPIADQLVFRGGILGVLNKMSYYVVNTDGTNLIHLSASESLPVGDFGCAQWMPDGMTVAYVYDRHVWGFSLVSPQSESQDLFDLRGGFLGALSIQCFDVMEPALTDLTGSITLPNRTPGTTVSTHSPTTDVNGFFTLQDLDYGADDDGATPRLAGHRQHALRRHRSWKSRPRSIPLCTNSATSSIT